MCQTHFVQRWNSESSPVLRSDVQYVYHVVVISILHQTYHISHLTLGLGQGQIITYDDNLKPVALMLSQI